MSSDQDALIETLARYISPVNARALVLRALLENGLSGDHVTRRDLRKCRSALRHGIELFVSPAKRDGAVRDLASFYGRDSVGPETCSVGIRSEADVGTARSEARRLCEMAGTDRFTMQKVTTIVSELARNIALYAEKGTIEMGPANGNSGRMLICAIDDGPGIPNLDHVLSGQYRSKTGLGRGLAGTKRLADRFDVKTGSSGTKIVVEVAL